jgi:uncharacterized protein
MQTSFDSDKRKFLSALCHVAIFFSAVLISIGVPIVVNIISDDPVVKESAKESINFHINVWALAIIIGIILFIPNFITFGFLGWIVFGIGYFLQCAVTVLAILHCLSQPDEPYRYPFIVRIF